jgi:hypothetical protein
MNLLSQVKRGKQKSPVLALISGPAGVGKSTFGASAPKPVFLGTENGTAFLDVARFPSPKTFDEVLQAILELGSQKHDFQTLVIDSLDWLEPLVWAKVCSEAEGSKKMVHIEDFGYGKGYVLALRHWQQMISDLTLLREKRGMNIILIAHSQIKKFEDPQTNSGYDRYVMKLHDKASALWREYVDVMGFATFEVATAKDKSGKERAFGGEARVLRTVYSAAWDAKNRMGLPSELPLSWDSFIEAYNKGCPEDPQVMKAHIEGMLERAPEDLKPKVLEALKEAGEDPARLAVIQNRLKQLVA